MGSCPRYSLIVSLPVLFRERLNVRGKVLKAMPENVYAVYLVHVLILIGLQALLLGVDVHPLLKFGIGAAVGVPLCFLVSHYLVRRIPYSQYAL